MELEYENNRAQIRTHIVYLEAKYTQEEIANLLTSETGLNFYAKDINLLKILSNNRWKRPSKKEKLNVCLEGLKAIWTAQENPLKTEIISPIEVQKISAVIKSAIHAEFQIYKNVPKVEIPLIKLKQFICQDSQAYSNIRKTIGRVISRKWTMQDNYNPSYCELLDLSIKRKSGNKVFVETYEHWFIKWYSFIEKDYSYIYENTNQQLYIVEKRGQDWIVISNIYTSPNTTAPIAGAIKNTYINVEEDNLETDKLS